MFPATAPQSSSPRYSTQAIAVEVLYDGKVKRRWNFCFGPTLSGMRKAGHVGKIGDRRRMWGSPQCS